MIRNGFLKMALIAFAAAFCVSAHSPMGSRNQAAAAQQMNGNGNGCNKCSKPCETCQPCKTCPEKKPCQPCKTCPEKKSCEPCKTCPEKKCEPCPCPATCDKPCPCPNDCGCPPSRKGAAKSAVNGN